MNLDEEYIHFQESITSLNRAWRTLCDLESHPSGNAIWSAAYRMAVVEYCKPFTKSQINKNERYKLTLPSVSSDLEQLHERLIVLRDKVMAHSDLSVLDAKVYYDKTAQYPVPLIVQNKLDSFPSVAVIKHLVETVLDALYAEEPEYENKYEQKP